jgi:hypothetical protein
MLQFEKSEVYAQTLKSEVNYAIRLTNRGSDAIAPNK